MVKYIIRDREAGNTIDRFNTSGRGESRTLTV